MTRSAVSHCRPWPRAAALGVAAAIVAPLAAPTAAQEGFARPVVQPLPDPATQRLNEALRTLSQDPRSVAALVTAGEASLALDDVDAAAGFIQRAEAIAPGDARVKAALAMLMVRRQQPLEALRLFAEAEQAGALSLSHVGERGLAYDLIGDNARAQQDYALVLSAGANAAITRRLALSQAIVGDQRASEATLLPLLQRSDLAAYRTRAFALAILGKADEAVSIAETMLPARLSSRMSPYLRYMPRLTRPQQAAAANLGVFPQAAQIGRDDPALAAYAQQTGAPPAGRSADARLVPTGEPLGSRSGVPRREEAAAGPEAEPPVVRAAVRPPEPSPTAPAPVQAVQAQPTEGQPALAQSSPVQPVEVQPVQVQPVQVQPVAAAPSPAEVPQPALSVAAQAEVEPVRQPSLAEAFAEFELAAAATGPAAGAVDITKIEPKREAPRVEAAAAAPAKPAPPPKPVHPSRHWVQIATGRDVGALAFDWRRIKRSAGGLLDRLEPHIAKWGQTNRLVVGPIANVREANELVGKLKDKEVDSFRFTSEQGEEVKPLD